MRTSPKSLWIALAALVVLGVVAYFVGTYWYGRHHLDAAHRDLARRDFRAAATHLRKCLSIWPDDRDLNLLLAQAYRRDGDMEAAGRQLAVCERKGVPDEAVALEHDLQRLQRGDLAGLFRLLGQCFERPDAAESPLIAEAALEGWTRKLPPVTQAVEVLGTDGAAVMKQTGQAIEYWLRSRPGAADQAQGLAWRARRHALLGEHAAAVSDLRQALELDADCFDARLWLAQLIAQRSPMEALEHYRVLQHRDPDNWSIRFGLASGVRGVGRLEDARPLLDELVAARPNEVPVLVERALLDLDLGQPAEAEARLRKALILAPTDPEILMALSRCLQSTGRSAEAREYYDRFLRAEAERKRGTEKRGRGTTP